MSSEWKYSGANVTVARRLCFYPSISKVFRSDHHHILRLLLLQKEQSQNDIHKKRIFQIKVNKSFTLSAIKNSFWWKESSTWDWSLNRILKKKNLCLRNAKTSFGYGQFWWVGRSTANQQFLRVALLRFYPVVYIHTYLSILKTWLYFISILSFSTSVL